MRPLRPSGVLAPPVGRQKERRGLTVFNLTVLRQGVLVYSTLLRMPHPVSIYNAEERRVPMMAAYDGGCNEAASQ